MKNPSNSPSEYPTNGAKKSLQMQRALVYLALGAGMVGGVKQMFEVDRLRSGLVPPSIAMMGLSTPVQSRADALRKLQMGEMVEEEPRVEEEPKPEEEKVEAVSEGPKTRADALRELRDKAKKTVVADVTEKTLAKTSPKPVRKKVLPKGYKTNAPAWAKLPPSSKHMTLSDRADCANAETQNYGAYKKPTTVKDLVKTRDGYDEQPLLGPRYRIYYPKKNPVEDGKYNVWFNFHGRIPWGNEWLTEMEETVLVNLDKHGLSGVYLNEFAGPHYWKKVLAKVNQGVEYEYNTDAEPELIGLSGWSAGCGALKRITAFDGDNIDSAVCLDGLHGGSSMGSFAREAVNGDHLFVINHSSIDPQRYESTTTSASKLIWWTGGDRPGTIPPKNGDAYSLFRSYDAGDFHVRGYRGADKPAHCAVFNHVPDILNDWVKPRGFR